MRAARVARNKNIVIVSGPYSTSFSLLHISDYLPHEQKNRKLSEGGPGMVHTLLETKTLP